MGGGWSLVVWVAGVSLLAHAHAHAQPKARDPIPFFLEAVPNVTVAVGRDASLACSVDHLGQHQVAWIHLDRQMIVSIHNHVIARQPRFGVTHDAHNTWTLHVTHVKEEDRGRYMCQVNSAPMISQTGFLQVVVPPSIVDSLSSKSNIVVREKENVTLKCNGTGFPKPKIKWRREDGREMKRDEEEDEEDGRNVQQLEGPSLRLQQVSRTHMGAYLCIASNGVPPSVSKRITLDVEFAPQMHVPNQLVGAPLSAEVHLECFVEAHPRAITYWEFRDAMVMNASRISTHSLEDKYKIHMVLRIRDLQEGDFGMYKCISKNSIAETDGSITLNKTFRPTTPPRNKLLPPPEANFRERDGWPGRKEQKRKESRRRQEDEGEEEWHQRRRNEEERRRIQELERMKMDHDLKRNHRNDLVTRITHPPGAGNSSNSSRSTKCMLQLLMLVFLLHQ